MSIAINENAFMKKAMEYIKTQDLNALPLGKHVIDEGNVWVNIVEAQLRPVEKALLEAHDVYIDIQVPLSGQESYGVKPRSACIAPRGQMDPVDDILFFDDKIEEVITKGPGEITVFAPDTAHAPIIGEGKLKKAIFKVRMQG